MSAQNSSILNEDFIKSLFKLMRSLHKITLYQGSETDLSAPQIQTLMFLKENQAASISDIAHNFNLALPTVTNILDRLGSAGLVSRLSDSSDHRIIRIELTKKGGQVLSEAVERKIANIKNVLSLLSEKDIKDLGEIIKKLSEKVEGLQK